MRIILAKIGLFFLPVCTLYSLNAKAYDLGQLTVRGFGALALTHAGNSQLGFRNDLNQDGQYGGWSAKSDSVLGVQIDDKLSDALSWNVQLVAKDQAHNTLNSYIERAHLSYQVNPNWRVRVGRLSNDILMTSEFGSVGYAYDWVRAPTEFYGEMPIYYIDGMDVTYQTPFRAGTLSSKIVFGQSDKRYFGDYSFKLFPFWSGVVRYDTNDLTLRATYTNSTLNNIDFPGASEFSTILSYLPGDSSALINNLNVDGQTFNFLSVGGEIRYGPWKFASEFGYLYSRTKLVLPYVSGYVSAFRRFGNWEVFGIGSFGETLGHSYQVDSSINSFSPMLYSILEQMFSSTQSSQQTVSFGTRWDITDGVALKAQFDHSWVKADQAFLWDSVEAHTSSQQMNTVTLAATFVF